MRTILFLFLPVLCFGQIKWDLDTVQYYDQHVRTHDNPEPLTCLVDDPHEIFYFYPDSLAELTHATKCIKIYIETDFATYNAFGGDLAAVQRWIDTIEVDIKKAFAKEELNAYFSEVLIPTAPTWADALTSLSDILYQFGKHRAGIQADLKHFITRRSMGGGIAWVNALCAGTVQLGPDQYYGPYAASANLAPTFSRYPLYSWTISVLMHEMGHNLGSRHTQSCSWGPGKNQAIDDCYTQEGGPCTTIMPIEYSTVMSYCHLTSKGISFMKGYGTEPGLLIRTRVSGAACLEICDDDECPEILNLSGSITGTYRANTINLNNVASQNLTLNTKVLNITSSTVNPVFEMISEGCP